MKAARAQVVLLVILLLACSSSHADPGDIAALLTHVPSQPSFLATLALILLVMIINYCVNLIVIGAPVARLSGLPFRSVIRPCILLTLVGQVADRVGFFLSIMVSMMVVDGPPWGGPESTSIMFVVSGVVVAIAVFVFLGVRWSLPSRQMAFLAAVAGVLTNPIWGLLCFRVITA